MLHLLDTVVGFEAHAWSRQIYWYQHPESIIVKTWVMLDLLASIPVLRTWYSSPPKVVPLACISFHRKTRSPSKRQTSKNLGMPEISCDLDER